MSDATDPVTNALSLLIVYLETYLVKLLRCQNKLLLVDLHKWLRFIVLYRYSNLMSNIDLYYLASMSH